jgi:UPF0271 protein
MPSIDLNADLGESFGAYTLGEDNTMLDIVTSASIACGFHAGDPGVMARTVAAAVRRGVCIGAHPGLPDLSGFGRRAMQITPDEVYDLVAYQIGALAAFARRAGTELQHVKPHGALYNMAEQDRVLAGAIARAARDWDTQMIVFGLSGGRLVQEASDLGLPVAHEVFADRTYRPDGTLTPRTDPGALIHDPIQAAARMVALLSTGSLTAADGTPLALAADTICLHGDTPGAAERAHHLRSELSAAGVGLRRPPAPR